MCHIQLSSFCVRQVFHLYILHFQWVFNHFQSIIFNSLHYIDGKLITTISSQNPILSNYDLIHLSELLSLSWDKKAKAVWKIVWFPLESCHCIPCLCDGCKKAWGFSSGLGVGVGWLPRWHPTGLSASWVQTWVQQSSGCCNHGEVAQSLCASIASFVKWG